MNVQFNILESLGPQIRPLRSMDEVERMTLMDPARQMPFIGEIIRNLRREVGGKAAVLGFVGLPFTLATYLIEGGPTQTFRTIKTFAHEQPTVIHALLRLLAENIGLYACYQIESGAQVIQVFDSWAGVLSPADYDSFALPYQQRVIQIIKQAHPEVPVIIYIHKSGALLEKMVASGADVVSLDWTVSLTEARRRLGASVRLQGNLDPMLLFTSPETIKRVTEEILVEGGGHGHIMNLGHGIEADTPEENAKLFVDTVQQWKKV